MSVQAITWALEQTVGSPTGKIVLLCLANYADKNGSCFPGHNTLARECEISKRSVVEWMQRLEAKKLLARNRRFRPDGSRTSDGVNLLMFGLSDTTDSRPDADFAPSEQPSADDARPSADDDINQVQQVHPKNRKRNRQEECNSKSEPSPLYVLEPVLGEELAKAVVDHRKKIRKGLTPFAAKLLLAKFEAHGNAKEAACAMIENGWQGFESDWLQNRKGQKSEQHFNQNMIQAFADLASEAKQ